jgi:hypothetical protein
LDLQQIVDITTLLANVATFLGIPLAIIVLIRDRQQARRAAELETYRALQSEYAEFLRLCLEHPELGLYDYKPQPTSAPTGEHQARRMIAYEMWVSMCESAFFLYHQDHRSSFRRRQWTGWDQYMRDWAERDDFRRAWTEHLGYQFDSEFVSYLGAIVREAEERHNKPLQPTSGARAADAGPPADGAARC